MDRTRRAGAWAANSWQFARHFLEMCAAMCIGGGILNGLVFLAGPALLGYATCASSRPSWRCW